MKSWLLWIFDPVAIGETFTFYGGGGSQSTTVQKSFTPEEERARADILAKANEIFGRVGGITPQFPGARPTPASAATLEAQRLVTQAATGSAQNVASQAAGALQFGLQDVLRPETNPALQARIGSATRRIGEAFTDPGGVLQNIRSGFTAGSTAGTSTRESIAGGLAGRSFLNTIGDVTAQLESEAYGQGLEAFNRTLAFSPQATQLLFQPAQALSAVGAQQEAFGAEEEAFRAAGREFNINAPFQQLGTFANIVAGLQAPATVTTGNLPQANPALGMAGGALAGYQLTGGDPYGAAAGAAIGLLLS